MDVALALPLALSGLIGVSLGIFGGGGSILAVPVLVYAARIAPAAAAGMSLAIVGATSLTASLSHHRRGNVRLSVALLFGGSGILTAFFGAKLTHLVSESTLMLAFAALMLLVGGLMLARRDDRGAAGEARPQHLVRAAFAGAGVGAVTGFLGVGGGFLIVPALVAFAGLGMREAIGTSLLVIAGNSAAGFAGHLGEPGLDFRLIVMFTVMAIGGAVAGAQLARVLPVARLRRGFALFVILVGVAVAVSTVV